VEEFTLSISERTLTGKAEVNRMRRDGVVPAIVYSPGEKSIAASVVTKEFTNLAKRASSAQLFTLKSESKSLNGKIAIVKEIQRDHLKGGVLHIDLLSLKEDREIVVQVPLHFVGEATGVKNEGGVMSVAAHQLSVSCLPRSIPKHIEINVSELALGDSIHASDIKLPQGVRLGGKPEETIVSVVLVRTVVETPAADAAAATAEGAAAAAPAEGAAAAEGAAKAEGAPAAGDAKAAAPAAGAKDAKGGKEKAK